MLTDKQCKNAICPADKKRARFNDAHGVYPEVSPAGSRRWFWKTYHNGKEGRLAFRLVQHLPFIQGHRVLGVARGQVSNQPKRLRSVATGNWVFGTRP